MPLRGLGWLGDGRDVCIENHENRFADRNALGERMDGDNVDNPEKLVRGAPPKPGTDGKRMGEREESGREKFGTREFPNDWKPVLLG